MCGLLWLWLLGSGAQTHPLWYSGLVALHRVWSSWTISVCCTGKQILHYWATREAPTYFLRLIYLPVLFWGCSYKGCYVFSPFSHLIVQSKVSSITVILCVAVMLPQWSNYIPSVRILVSSDHFWQKDENETVHTLIFYTVICWNSFYMMLTLLHYSAFLSCFSQFIIVSFYLILW